MDLSFQCAHCGRRYPADTRAWRCACGGPFDLAQPRPFSAAAIQEKDHTLWRYRGMISLPEVASPVSLGEGSTPLVPLRMDGRGDLHCKLEFLAPTGSYKDRGTAVLVSALASWGVSQVVEDSSGNAAASLAAYCAHAGIRARIFVPAYTSGPKLAQIRAYGAELVAVEGPRENATRAAREAAGGSYYASHAAHPLHLEGIKTFAYELWEQLGRAPDALVFPTGHGTFLLGAYRGFQDLLSAGLVDALPRLFAVQSEACAPLYRAHREGAEEIRPGEGSGETIAEGIRIIRPARSRDLLHAIRETGSEVVTVTDEEIRRAQRELAGRGLYVEPTSAAALAGLIKLPSPIEGTTVLPLTGSGLKGSLGATF